MTSRYGPCAFNLNVGSKDTAHKQPQRVYGPTFQGAHQLLAGLCLQLRASCKFHGTPGQCTQPSSLGGQYQAGI
jgi:hypothetical protein